MVKIDLTYLESIAGGDQDFIKQMLGMFRSSTIPDAEKIEQYYLAENWPMVSAMAHKIKSPVQMLGQTILLDKIMSVEKLAKEKINLTMIPDLLKEMMVDLEEMATEVDRLIKTM
jgi:HPt (histidine-containing phosphotransfer) domain-containing protein